MPDQYREAAAEAGQHETLKFHFTPVEAPNPARAENPHAKATTHLPQLADALRERFGDAVRETESYAGETSVLIACESLLEIARALYDDHGFTYLSDLGGLDRFTEDDRFEIHYNLLNLQGRQRLRLRVRVGEDEPTVPSVTGIWRSANWNERECYDMFGIRFSGHEDMRRMLMPEDFDFHPLRKEFPLLGIPGSLPLPPQTPEGEVTMDPFAAAHGSKPIKSYQEPRTQDER